MPENPFLYTVTVRLHDVDAAGIVFFGHYFRYAHDAYEAFMAEIGFPITEMIQKKWMLPLVHSEADFKQPARQGERITIELRPVRIGKSSFTIGYMFKIKDREIAKLTTTHVSLGRSGKGAERIPSPLESELCRYLAN
jgi:1,4-dihydroxy-2-naphthoyl-CoA hydrolase